MGGRGTVGRGSGNNKGKYVKEDKSEVIFANRYMTATKNVVKALGEENLVNISEYVNEKIKLATGLEEYVKLNMIAGATGNVYAWMDGNGTIGINPDLFKKDITEIKRSYERDVKSNFHPKNTSFNDVAVHEAAHNLDFNLSTQLFKQNKIGLTEMASTPIVRRALNNLKAAGDKRTFLQMQEDLSRYGAKFYKEHTGNIFIETFAEAIADYGANQGKANPLSVEIVKVTKEFLKN